MDRNKPVNRWQEVLHDLCISGTVNPKAIAHRLHKYGDYLSDICRRERVDPMAVFNAILIDADRRLDPADRLALAAPIMGLLVDGTTWTFYQHTPLRADDSFRSLLENTGVMCEDLGGAIRSLARIEADGHIDSADDADIEECQQKMRMLMGRITNLSAALSHRRQETAT